MLMFLHIVSGVGPLTGEGPQCLVCPCQWNDNVDPPPPPPPATHHLTSLPGLSDLNMNYHNEILLFLVTRAGAISDRFAPRKMQGKPGEHYQGLIFNKTKLYHFILFI